MRSLHNVKACPGERAANRRLYAIGVIGGAQTGSLHFSSR
jgi:hypothetical protein